jgi:hypothetical protein
MLNDYGKDPKKAFGGTDGKPILFYHTGSKEAGIHKIFLTAIGLYPCL